METVRLFRSFFRRGPEAAEVMALVQEEAGFIVGLRRRHLLPPAPDVAVES